MWTWSQQERRPSQRPLRSRSHSLRQGGGDETPNPIHRKSLRQPRSHPPAKVRNRRVEPLQTLGASLSVCSVARPRASNPGPTARTLVPAGVPSHAESSAGCALRSSNPKFLPALKESSCLALHTAPSLGASFSASVPPAGP